MKFILMTILSFFLLVSYQNCADVGPNMAPGDTNLDNANKGDIGGEINCMAIATPYVEMGFDFSSSSQTSGLLPSYLELEINGKVVYSDCQNLPSGYIIDRREGTTLNIRQDFLEDGPEASMDIRLYKKTSCSDTNKQEVLSINEQPEYQTYQICRTSALFWKADYLVN